MSYNCLKSAISKLVGFLIEEKLFMFLTVLFFVLTVLTGKNMINTITSFDVKSLVVLVSIMISSRGVVLSGFSDEIARRFLIRKKKINVYLFTSGFLVLSSLAAMLMMNDGSIFILVPMSLIIAKSLGIEPKAFVILTIIASNVGSMLSPVGNPQNIVIWSKYGIPALSFVKDMLPIYLSGLVLLLAYNRCFYKTSEMRAVISPGIKINWLLGLTSVLLVLTDVLLVEVGYWFITLPLNIIVLFTIEKNVLLNFDYVLIGIFALMFIDFNSLSSILFSYGVSLKGSLSVYFAGITFSQVISNVPTTLTLSNLTASAYWKELSWGVNIGGLGLVHSSFANIIGLRLSGLKIKEYHRIAVPFFIFYVLIGCILLLFG